MPAIQPPVFGDALFDVRAFGAVDDGKTANTGAFRAAIEACAEAGGTVQVPAGEWLTGPIHLRSRVRLHLAAGAVVRFSTRFADYLPVVFTRWEGHECYNYSPLIYAHGCTDIAVTGSGTIDGRGEAWWPWSGREAVSQAALFDAQKGGIPVERRVYGKEGKAFRPPLLQPIHCRNILIEGVTFRNGPMWTIHPVYCENVLVRGVRVRTEGPNTDGLNPDSCRNVLVEHCCFATGDDCIAINSGKNEDGRRVGRPCENLLIRHCRMKAGHGGVVIGSGMSGGVRNLHVHDCAFHGLERGIRLKSIRGRGGVVEDIWFENITMSRIRDEAIVMSMDYNDPTVEPRMDAAPIFRNIHVRHATCDGAAIAVRLRGLPESPLRDITFEHLRIRANKGMDCDHVEGLVKKDVSIRSGTEGTQGK